MENKIKVAIFFLVILLLSFIGLAGYILYGKEDLPNPNENNTTTTTISSLKLDIAKDWVYKAEYTYEVEEESYNDIYDTTFSVKNIKAPYININSSDAQRINKQIKEVFDKLIDEYKEALVNKEATSTLKYESYLNENILSVVIEHLNSWNESEYYTYNLNIKTGKLLTFEEIYQIVGLTEVDIEPKLEQAITDYINNFLEETNQDLPAEKFINESMEMFYNSLEGNQFGYFFDKNNNLNIITVLSLPVGHGTYYKILTLK